MQKKKLANSFEMIILNYWLYYCPPPQPPIDLVYPEIS